MLKSTEVIYQHFFYQLPPYTRGLSCLNCTKHPDYSQTKLSAVWVELLTRVNCVYLSQRSVCVCVHVSVHFMYICISALYGVESARVFV